MMTIAIRLILLTAAFAGWVAAAANPPTELQDRLVLGNDTSEKAHQFQAGRSETATGLLGETGRRLLPLEPQSWEGGRISFLMKVDPKLQNYCTVRCSGDEINANYLILFCEGKQIGYRHLGDIDVLALPDEAPRYNGRFYYVTTPLPLALTSGKSEIHLEIRSTGPIWGYGGNWDQYQKQMTKPSRVIYSLATHTDGFFAPPADERQGQEPQAGKRTQPGPEVLAKAQERVNGTLAGFLKSKRPLNQMQVQFLAHAYFVAGTPAHQSSKVVEQVVAGVDELYRRFKAKPDELWKDKATWNPEWFGVAPGADAVRCLAKPLETALDQPLDGAKTRRAAWSEMFQASRDWLNRNRRWLTNQAMFTDTNIYLSNCGVAAIDPANAWPEAKALDILYQGVGLVPWLGKETANGPEKLFGSDFYQVTQKGLSRERGYAGGYGEGGVEGAIDMYEATRGVGPEGDPKLKAQMLKMMRARAPFRYPMLDDEGHPCMRLETAVGWRDTHLPGEVMYVQRAGGNHSALEIAALTLDPEAVGYARQMLDDNQFFATVAKLLQDNRLRTTIGLLGLTEQYELVKKQPDSGRRLPMSWDQPDFVFADEEAGVVAIKNGREILYASLYWRAGYGVNSLARIHYLTPNYQQVAVVREETQIEPSGQTYKRKDWINFGFGKGGTNIHYPADIHQALAGEELPIAKIPADVKLKPGDESHFAGKADFYVLHYGPYLIAMNTTKDKTYDLPVPAGSFKDQITGKPVAGNDPIKVGPRSTIVLHARPVQAP